jgi:hypothetical protein
MSERKAVVRQMAARYRRAGKKERGRLLDELVALTGYNRRYAVGLLGHPAQKPVEARKARSSRVRQRHYDASVLAALRRIWVILDCICGKRLAAVLPDTIAVLERAGELRLEPSTRNKLLTISAASIDRLLRPERARLRLRARSATKPGTLLRHQIAVRTFAEWDHSRPGFVEIDLVGHDGGMGYGDFCQSLNLTDVASGWTEAQAVLNKAQVWVFEALQDLRARLPFELKGIDSDNGSEFINHQLVRYAEQQKITFTRGRAWKKNDGCFVEQKNYSVVRRAVGYARYEGHRSVRLLNALYGQLRLYTNFFLPVMKLIAKERIGAKVRKTYDRPSTPYQRLLRSQALSASAKRRLRAQHAELNPAELKRNIAGLQSQLLKLALRQMPVVHAPGPRPTISKARTVHSDSYVRQRISVQSGF